MDEYPPGVSKTLGMGLKEKIEVYRITANEHPDSTDLRIRA